MGAEQVRKWGKIEDFFTIGWEGMLYCTTQFLKNKCCNSFTDEGFERIEFYKNKGIENAGCFENIDFFDR
jgi:hypothetical protein